MIKKHRWTCKKCDDKLYLEVNDEIALDNHRFALFQDYASRHVITTGHEMIHTEKEDKGFRYV